MTECPKCGTEYEGEACPRCTGKVLTYDDLRTIVFQELPGHRNHKKRQAILKEAAFIAFDCKKKEERTITTTGYQSS